MSRTHFSRVPLKITALVSFIVFFSCNKEKDKPAFLQENPAEHNHLIESEKLFAQDLRLDFSFVTPSDDGNLYYIASNGSEDIEYFTIIVGQGPVAPPPANTTGHELGKMTLQGNKIWAKGFPFVPKALLIHPVSGGEVLIVVGGEESSGHISILSNAGITLGNYEYPSAFESYTFLDIAHIPGTNRFVLSGSSHTSQNGQGYVPHLVELEFDEGDLSFEVVREKSFFAYQAWPLNIKAIPGSTLGDYVLTLQQIPGYGNLVFLDSTLDITRSTSLYPMQPFLALSEYGQLLLLDDRIYITSLFPDSGKPAGSGNFRSIQVRCFNLNGEMLWNSKISLTEYDEIPRNIVPYNEYLYILGEQSGQCDVKGEEKVCFSNALVAKINASDGQLVKAFTFSKNTAPWDNNNFDAGFIKDGKFYIFGTANEQPVNEDERERDGWFVTLRMQDL